MNQITYREALRMALQESMREDSTIIVMGEDVGLYGGAYGVTKGMIEEFGEKRILDTQFQKKELWVVQWDPP